VIAVARGDTCLGLLALGDSLRADARQAVAALRGTGLETILVTGDNERTARVIAGKLGIDAVHAGVLPGGKAEIIRQLQAGGRVAMVGDGINDAPALMQADVGIAIGAGTDIAIESADIVLVGHRLGAVVEAFSIGRLSYRKTVQNLALAFAFNGIGVPLAVTGLVHPVWAMIAMAASVTAVLTNSFAGRLLPAKKGAQMHASVTYTIANMHCEHCLASIAEAVRKLDGIEDVSGEPEKKLVTVTYRADRAAADGIREAIIERGFEVMADKSGKGSVIASVNGERYGMGA
jgi:P-type Cu+ transporter